MVKPIKQFEISSLKVSGFKCFAEERSFSFGPMNAIFGHNAQGKSTIADAISYAITGVSFFGSNRMDRLRAPGKNISVELQIVDGEGQPHCLIRNRVGDNTDVFWDGQPIAAKDLNTVFAERDLFLAVFNPLYLIEVLGNKGRDLFERYMPEVPHEKVMEQLSEHNQSILAQNPFLSPEALVKQTRESIRELESTLTYCQGQQDLLRSQREQSGVLLADRQKELQDCRVRIQELESIRTTGFDGSDLKERLADLYSLHEEYVREQASLPQTDDLDAKFRDLTQKRAKREADVYHSQYAQALADTQKQINELGMELARHRHILAGLQPGNTIQFSQFAAVSKDSDEVLGKILYYTLSSILIDREVLARLCDTVDFPYKPIRRSSLADAFRSATGDIYHRLVVKDAGVPQIINVYCRDNRGPKGIISRELVKETLHEDTNEYKKLANISLDRGSGVFSYDNLEADPNVDALSCCQDAQELFALYQTCASRRQIDTLLQNYLDTMQAVKAARGRIYFIPRDYMPKLALFEDFIALLEQHNQHKYADRLPLDANSMFVVDDEKQRSKMALAFYRTIQKDLAEYEKRATHLIQSGNQSPAIMDRMVLSIRELERKKIYYESILKQELHEVDEQYTSLRYLSDELQIRARSIQAQKRLAA